MIGNLSEDAGKDSNRRREGKREYHLRTIPSVILAQLNELVIEFLARHLHNRIPVFARNLTNFVEECWEHVGKSNEDTGGKGGNQRCKNHVCPPCMRRVAQRSRELKNRDKVSLIKGWGAQFFETDYRLKDGGTVGWGKGKGGR